MVVVCHSSDTVMSYQYVGNAYVYMQDGLYWQYLERDDQPVSVLITEAQYIAMGGKL